MYWTIRPLALADNRNEAGMATAEYAVVTVAAVAFAGILIKLLTSSQVQSMLMGIIRSALSLAT